MPKLSAGNCAKTLESAVEYEIRLGMGVGTGVGVGVGVGVGGLGVGVGGGGGACVGVGVQVNEQVKETVKLSTISRLIVLLVSVQSPVFDPCIVQLTKWQHPPSIAWSTTTWASS